ncbi:DUF998 domain-containing protein [Streptomyces sp. 11-1-2]|uniref:DUF998 domain-containing protein n=1 Tax=unclassified Streptomyces TaxID=2593676 RepID=UPI000B8D6BF0|nr:DUF998 domain-containing protein [Streptomyces sp. 11-1-2]ASQ92194.1 hypothetical protein CGL27_02600 [Streptomyces sp. 11-1-2]
MIRCLHNHRAREGGQVKARIGYSAWVAGVVQFFAVHWFVESAWARPYSWAWNNISDLGNAHCALQPDPEPRYVCSPEHAAMNASFIALGTLLVIGTALTGTLWRRGSASTVTRLLLAGAGVGFVLAGLAPADVHENQHVLGALLIMGTGNVGLLLTGARLADDVPGPLRRVTSLLGITALTAFGLFLSRHYLGLGMGGMERVAAFPLLAWALVVGSRGLFRQKTRTPDTAPESRIARAPHGQ